MTYMTPNGAVTEIGKLESSTTDTSHIVSTAKVGARHAKAIRHLLLTVLTTIRSPSEPEGKADRSGTGS